MIKPTPMPKKTGTPKRPVMLPKTGPVRSTPKPSGLMGMAKGGMAKSKGMAYGGMTEKPMGMAKGGMTKAKGMAKKGKK